MHGTLDTAAPAPSAAPGPVPARRESVYQPLQEGLVFPTQPRFDDPAQERRHRRERLAAACRAFALEGFDYGFAGHLTVRDPEHPELYWTNPMCVHFANVRVSNLILVDHDGRVREGRHAVNRAGFVLHAAVHAAHPEIVAMCHAHTVYGTAYAALGRELPPITQDAAAFFEDHRVIRSEAGQVAVEESAGRSVAAQFKGVKAVIHQNHGLFTASTHGIESAAFWFIALERCCRQQLLVDASGHAPVPVDERRARFSREHVGSDYIGWLHFQTIFDGLQRSQPDLFD
ncbi:class II aldolase/adducin family protein [Piscinibacter sakaiensis]|nr:class II aldolase/adducin family protein [Piscinibacter sakaiensis]